MTNEGTISASSSLRVSGRARSIDIDDLRSIAERPGGPSVVEVGPTGVSVLEPLVAATLEGRTAFLTQCSNETAQAAAETLADGELPTGDATAVVEHDPETATLPRPSSGPLAVGTRRILGACGWVDPRSEVDYLARGTPLSERDDLLEHASAVGLRGRGRGDGATDEPITERWETAIATDGEPVVVVHANEADARIDTDSLLLAADPFAVLEPATAVADRIGASDVVVYLPGDDERVHRTTTAAATRVEEFDAHDVSIDVVVGPDTYRAGEPTMALEALEGADRIEARRRPPGPAEHGLYGRPTVVHTPRTLAQLRATLVSETVPGVEDDPGTRTFRVAGDVESPAVVELSTSESLSTVLEGVDGCDRPKAACVGGVFGGLTDTLDIGADVSELTAAGVGTDGAIELFDDDRCIVAFAGRRAAFASEENCGRCVPCREGSTQLTELLRSVYGDADAIDDVRELARVMNRSSLCAFGRDAARPVTTALTAFESEFLAHADGRCPTGECSE